MNTKNVIKPYISHYYVLEHLTFIYNNIKLSSIGIAQVFQNFFFIKPIFLKFQSRSKVSRLYKKSLKNLRVQFLFEFYIFFTDLYVEALSIIKNMIKIKQWVKGTQKCIFLQILILNIFSDKTNSSFLHL